MPANGDPRLPECKKCQGGAPVDDPAKNDTCCGGGSSICKSGSCTPATLDSVDGKVNDKKEEGVAFKTGGTTVKFTSTAKGNCDFEYQWDFGDGQTDTTQNPAHTYTKPGEYNAKVTVKCKKCGPPEKTDKVKVTVVRLKLQEVSFSDNLEIYKDVVGSANEIVNPVWKDGDLNGDPEINDPIGYVRKNSVKLSAKFKVEPTPSSPISGVTIKGAGPDSLDFKAENITLSGDRITIPVTPSDTPLPDQTKFYNPLSIKWTFSTKGSDEVPIGTSTHKTYVTLSEKGFDTPRIYLTTLHLAVSNDGAKNKTEAFLKSWQIFSGKNLKTWEDNNPRLLYYYKEGISSNYCYSDVGPLLISFSGSGTCNAFGLLFQEVMGINGINTTPVIAKPNDGSLLVVKKWTFGNPAIPGSGDCQWEIKLNNSGTGIGPALPGDKFGDMLNEQGIPGQNMGTPSEKVFEDHFIVKVVDSDVDISAIGGQYFDASYGVVYADALDFQKKAIDGFVPKIICERINPVTRSKEQYTGVRKASDVNYFGF